jgi:mono/diheme cytochrome c family protein
MSLPGALRSMLVTALGAVALAGCGGTGVPNAASVDLTQGKQLFVSTCGICHTMSEAGTSGKTGPDLDAAYAGDRIIGMKVSSFEAMVREQIDLADPPMPRHLLKGAEADDVAAYVASVAGKKLAAQYNPGTSPP